MTVREFMENYGASTKYELLITDGKDSENCIRMFTVDYTTIDEAYQDYQYKLLKEFENTKVKRIYTLFGYLGIIAYTE